MMANFFRDITRLFVDYVDLKARLYTTNALEETRHMISGMLLLAASGIFWGIGLVFLFLALFFRLTDQLAWMAKPAAITAGAGFVVGAVITAIAAKSLKKRQRPVSRVQGTG